MRGATLVRTPLYLIGGLALLLVITLGFFEGRKAYWDHRVRELCKKDGGVDVVEQVRLTVDDYRRLGGAYGEIPVPERRSAPNTAEFVSDTERHLIREGSPTVWRTEATVHAIRTNRTLARYVNYSRSGGDFPSFAHPSSFSCDQGRGSISKKVFLIEGSVE